MIIACSLSQFQKRKTGPEIFNLLFNSTQLTAASLNLTNIFRFKHKINLAFFKISDSI